MSASGPSVNVTCEQANGRSFTLSGRFVAAAATAHAAALPKKVLRESISSLSFHSGRCIGSDGQGSWVLGQGKRLLLYVPRYRNEAPPARSSQRWRCERQYRLQ